MLSWKRITISFGLGPRELYTSHRTYYLYNMDYSDFIISHVARHASFYNARLHLLHICVNLATYRYILRPIVYLRK